MCNYVLRYWLFCYKRAVELMSLLQCFALFAGVVAEKKITFDWFVDF